MFMRSSMIVLGAVVLSLAATNVTAASSGSSDGSVTCRSAAATRPKSLSQARLGSIAARLTREPGTQTALRRLIATRQRKPATGQQLHRILKEICR